jgi:hypothetical protein
MIAKGRVCLHRASSQKDKLTSVFEECLTSLHFTNTRYDKISREHQGSFEWIWTHTEYKDWFSSETSRLLHIQGKPGSGKSTLVKYFSRNFQERHSTTDSCIVASFFYSAREGELQRSHYNMLRSILYDILAQDEVAFYPFFQIEYRKQALHDRRATWNYESLKTVLRSLHTYPLRKRLYLIIDAVDESEESDRREILNLLFKLCSPSGDSVMKGFVASRPIGQLEIRRNTPQNFIELQQETLFDIRCYTNSFLNGLHLTHVLEQATRYIVENAHEVFIWVRLVGEELLQAHEDGYSEEDIFELLKQLPVELDEFYRHMFHAIVKKKRADVAAGVKLFQFVLFAKRPLTLDEFLHALSIGQNSGTHITLSDNSFQKHVPSERRIIVCGGNFVEVKRRQGSGMLSAPDLSSRFESLG